VAALNSALRGGSDGSSVLLVGEHGVGKSAVLREVLGPLRRDGWLIFEASATELMAGQVYVGELDTRLREIAERSAGRPVLWIMPAFAEAISAGQHSRSRVGALDSIRRRRSTSSRSGPSSRAGSWASRKRSTASSNGSRSSRPA